MKKVVYSIRKVKGNFDEKISGLGFINDEGTLFCKCVSKNGKQYTRAFDDVEQHCFPVSNIKAAREIWQRKTSMNKMPTLFPRMHKQKDHKLRCGLNCFDEISAFIARFCYV